MIYTAILVAFFVALLWVGWHLGDFIDDVIRYFVNPPVSEIPALPAEPEEPIDILIPPRDDRPVPAKTSLKAGLAQMREMMEKNNEQ